MDAHGKLLILRCVVALSILNTLSIFTFHKLLLDSKMLKMLKMFILSSSVLLIIFRCSFLLSQHVRKYGLPFSVAALFGSDAEDSFRPQERLLGRHCGTDNHLIHRGGWKNRGSQKGRVSTLLSVPNLSFEPQNAVG